MENVPTQKSPWLNTNTDDNVLVKALNNHSVTPSLNIYGSGADLQDAMKKYSGISGVTFKDTSKEGFDPSTMNNGIMLGGSAVNTNVNNDMLNKSGVQRVWGQDAAGTANSLADYMKNYGKPTLPTLSDYKKTEVKTPEFTPFVFSGNLQTYLDQAQNALAPQKQLAEQSINDNYDSSIIPAANNDTLSRGLARSSYAGNRVDQANANRQKELTNADLQIAQQANTLGMQNYDKAYDRELAAWNSKNQFDWNKYNTDNQSANQDFQNAMALYNAHNDNYWKDRSYEQQNKQFEWQQIKDKNEENWKKQNQFNWQQEFDTKNNQWNQEYNYEKDKDAKAYELQRQQLALSKARSTGGGNDGYTKSDIAEQTKIKYLKMVNSGNLESAKEFLDENADEIMRSAGTSTYKSLVVDWQSRAKKEQAIGEDY